ncbi:hypothetical protein Pcinc_016399 [Petrolisthes cinctipes]|uniref:Uncharacterized protein n=1 Tax=Petrolisthes cinctipes TaxID=88211 RepID=A0AAE1FTR7_PETCI|nr:hypothetical protein Pcinc_016399 [Petrolisthes cinctipes]
MKKGKKRDKERQKEGSPSQCRLRRYIQSSGRLCDAEKGRHKHGHTQPTSQLDRQTARHRHRQTKARQGTTERKKVPRPPTPPPPPQPQTTLRKPSSHDVFGGQQKAGLRVGGPRLPQENGKETGWAGERMRRGGEWEGERMGREGGWEGEKMGRGRE